LYDKNPLKNKNMKIVTTREITRQPKVYFELAKEEQVVVKRGHEYVHQIVSDRPDAKFVSDEWLDKFFKIPAEYRCNPFEISPSGDLYFADKRNVEHIEEGIEQAKNGQVKKISINEIENFFEL
jgi:hypothetical protein